MTEDQAVVAQMEAELEDDIIEEHQTVEKQDSITADDDAADESLHDELSQLETDVEDDHVHEESAKKDTIPDDLAQLDAQADQADPVNDEMAQIEAALENEEEQSHEKRDEVSLEDELQALLDIR